MKRGTKITVFIASMALTVGSLIATVGAHRYGHYRNCGTNAHWGSGNYSHHGCGWNSNQTDSVAK